MENHDEMKTKIRCYRKDCIFNDNAKSNAGYCKRKSLWITDGISCADYRKECEE